MNETVKLTQKEAEHLLEMLKKSLTSEISFPEKGNSVEFDVVGSKKKDYLQPGYTVEKLILQNMK